MAKKKREVEVNLSGAGALADNPQSKPRTPKDTKTLRRGNSPAEKMVSDVVVKDSKPKSKKRTRRVPGMPVATMSPGPELSETAELGLLGSTKVVKPSSGQPSETSTDSSPSDVETVDVQDVGKQKEELLTKRGEALDVLNAHVKEHGESLSEDHPEYQKRLELTQNRKDTENSVKTFNRRQKNLSESGGVSKRGTNQFSAKTASVAGELGMDDLTLHKQHLQDMQFHARNSENAATPEAAAGHLAKADEARNRARALDVELRLGERASGIHTACPTEGCHGVSNTGLCADCTIHENEKGENTGKTRVRALRKRLTGQSNTADVNFGETPIPGEPEHEFTQRTGITDALQYRRERAERAPRTGKKVEEPTELSESQKAEDKMQAKAEDKMQASNLKAYGGLDWWSAQVTSVGTSPQMKGRRNPALLPDWAKPEETPVGGKKRASNLPAGPSPEQVKPVEQPTIGKVPAKKASLVEAGVTEFSESEVKERAGAGLGPKIGEKLGRTESFASGSGQR